MKPLLSIVLVLLTLVGQQVTFRGGATLKGQAAVAGSADDSIIQGAGAPTVGGQGGTALTIDTLSDVDDSAATTATDLLSNKGTDGLISIREVATVTGARIATFSVSGNISLSSSLTFSGANLTLDGSTAPNGGVQVINNTAVIGASQLIIKYMRFRPGFGAPNHTASDAVQGAAGFEFVVLDHCEMAWAADENFGNSSTLKNVTIQWSIVAGGLNFTNHADIGNHSMGVTYYRNADHAGNGRVTVHHSLIINCHDRHPEVGEGTLLDWVNNVCYNGLLWNNFFLSASTTLLNGGIDASVTTITVDSTANFTATGKGIVDSETFSYTGKTGTQFTGVTRGVNGSTAASHSDNASVAGTEQEDRVFIDFVGNYYKEGPMSEPTGHRKEFTRSQGNWAGDGAVYVSGNIGPNRPTLGDPESAMLDTLALNEQVFTPHVSPPSVNATSAAQAYDDVIAKAGCRLPYRDGYTQQLLWEAQNGWGVFIDNEEEIGGYPNLTLASNTRTPSVSFIANFRLQAEGANINTITTESGHTFVKHPSFTGNITLDQQRRAFSGDTIAYYTTWVPSGADYYFKCRTVQLSSLGRACVCARMDTVADTMYCACRTTSSTLTLIKRVAGVESGLGSSTASTNLESLKIKAVGTTIQAWTQGQSRISVTDSDISAIGRGGYLFSGGGSASTGFHLNRTSGREY